MKSEGASSGFASASDLFVSKSAYFPQQSKDLNQPLMNLIPSMQVFLSLSQVMPPIPPPPRPGYV